MPVLLLACFVLSGASSLVLQVVWTRQLAQVFGSSSLAISTVLATFMGGLALGSALGGRWADRNPQRGLPAYALCELGVAVFALLIPLVLETYPAANAWLWKSFHEQPALLAALRFGLCALLLLPPTTLMGATLPILARHVVQRPDDLGFLGSRVGTLYASNTVGAVVGAGGAGFYLLPLIGQRATYATAIVADVFLAVAIFAALAYRKKYPREENPLRDPQLVPGDIPPAPPVPLTERQRLGVLVAVGLSGATAMALEVLWSRALSLVIGSSVYSFTLVLVVFLLGLSAGAAWIGRPAARSRRPLAILGVAYLGVGGSIVLTHRVIDDLPTVFIQLIEGTRLEISTIMGLQALCAALAIAPTAACLGAVWPLVVRAYAGDVAAVGRDVGRAYTANTIGAILGSLAGGFLILPLVGLENGVRAAALVILLLGAAMAHQLHKRGRLIAYFFTAVMALAVLVAPRWDVGVLTSGVFRMSTAKRYAKAGYIDKADVVFYEDGVTTTVSVERYGDRFALKNNGKVEASSVGDMPTQVLVGLLPLLAQGGQEQRVAVVGYGSGITVGAIAESPFVQRVDVVELEPAVNRAADKFFGLYNHAAHVNPRVHRWIGDGRNFLTAHPEKYHVIVSEPSNPWIAGVAALFTREFYGFAKQHLTDDGVFCQWAQLYELGPGNVKTIYRTFQEAFPYVVAWIPADSHADTILVGSQKPIRLDMAQLERLAEVPKIKAELARGGVSSAAEVVAQIIMTPAEVPVFAAGARVNTDDNARLEFSAPRDLLGAGRGNRFADEIYGWTWPYGHLDSIVTGLGEGADKAARELRLARALIGKGRRREAATWLARARASGAVGEDLAVVELVLRAAQTRDFGDPETPPFFGGTSVAVPSASWFDPAIPLADREAAARKIPDIERLVASGREEDAVDALRLLPRSAPGAPGRDLRLLRAYAHYRNLDMADAEGLLRPLAKDEAYLAERPAALYYYGRALLGAGQFEQGADVLEQVARKYPQVIPAEPLR